MADRSVKVILTAQAQGYISEMQKAAQATRETGSAAEKLAQQQEAFTKMGQTAMVAGGAMAVGLGISAKAAIEWDSAWAGVTKTVDGSPEQLAQVEAGLRGLTSVLLASHTEIAAVAEAAGQLGIQTPNVVAFTKTMIDLGETTNLSAEEAATQLARFVNVMGTSQSQVSNLGAALVELGNNYATTEAEILSMAQRLSGAGVQIGMSEGQVLGLSTALSSVGIEAEAGGSAMSKVMIDIASSVDKGGERLELFASVAGESADSFATKWRSDPGAALAAFVQGLANAEQQGKSTFGVLEELGITEVRMRDALLRSASAAGQFSEAMRTGNDAFQENTALVDEAEKRYNTVASKLGIMRNQVTDAAISLGDHLLPAIGGAAEGIGNFADMLAGLDGPMGAVVAWGGLLAAGILFTGGVALASVPKIAAYKVALETLGVSTAGLSGKLRGVGAFLTGPWGIALLAGAAGVRILGNAMDEAKASAADFEIGIKQSKDVFTVMQEEASKGLNIKGVYDVAGSVENLGAVLEDSAGYANSFTKAMSQDFDHRAVIDSLREAGRVLAQTASTDMPSAVAEFSKFAKTSGLTREQLALAIEEMPEFKSVLLDAASAANLATNDAALLKFALGELGPGTDASATKASEAAAAYVEQADAALEAAAGLMGLIDALNEANGVGQSAEAANSRYQQTLDEVADAVEQAKAGVEGYSTSMDASTVEGAKNREMMAGLAADSQKAAYALMEQETATLGADKAAENYSSRLADGREKLIAQIEALTGSRDMAIKFADAVYKIPTQHELKLISNAAEESRKAAEHKRIIDSIPDKRHTDLFVNRGNSQEQLNAHISALNSIPGYRETVINTVVRQTGAPRGQVGAAYNEDGGMYVGGVKYFDRGGIEPGTYTGGRTLYGFAEPGVPWETFISGKESERDRNRQIWAKTGDMLGMNVSGSQAAPIVYVQNPFTGEYLLAQVADVADAKIDGFASEQARAGRMARS